MRQTTVGRNVRRRWLLSCLALVVWLCLVVEIARQGSERSGLLLALAAAPLLLPVLALRRGRNGATHQARVLFASGFVSTLVMIATVLLASRIDAPFREDFGPWSPAAVAVEAMLSFKFTFVVVMTLALLHVHSRLEGAAGVARALGLSLPLLFWGLEATWNQWLAFWWSGHSAAFNVWLSWHQFAACVLALGVCTLASGSLWWTAQSAACEERMRLRSRQPSWAAGLVATVAAVLATWLGVLYLLERNLQSQMSARVEEARQAAFECERPTRQLDEVDSCDRPTD